MASFAFRRLGYALLGVIILAHTTTAHAGFFRPTWKKATLLCSLLVVGAVGSMHFYPDSSTVHPEASHTRRVGTGQGSTSGVFAADDLEARYEILDRNGAIPQVELLNKNWRQKLMSKAITQRAKDMEEDPVRKARITVGEQVTIQIERLEVVRDSTEAKDVTLRLILGPLNLSLEKRIPLADLESGDILEVRFPAVTNKNPDGDSFSASVGMSLRLGTTPDTIDILDVEGGVALSTRFGNEEDRQTVTNLRARRIPR